MLGAGEYHHARSSQPASSAGHDSLLREATLCGRVARAIRGHWLRWSVYTRMHSVHYCATILTSLFYGRHNPSCCKVGHAKHTSVVRKQRWCHAEHERSRAGHTQLSHHFEDRQQICWTGISSLDIDNVMLSYILNL